MTVVSRKVLIFQRGMGRPKTEAKRRAILDAAARTFAKKGYHATSVADVAAAVGMGLGTFYRYFESKLDVFHAVIDEVLAHVATVVARDAAGEAKNLEAYRAQVQRLGDALFQAFVDNADLGRLLFVEAPGIDAALNAKLSEATTAFGAMTQAYLTHGKERGFLRDDLDVEITALAINGMIFEGVRSIANTANQAEAKQRWSRAVERLMFDGIKRG